MVFDSFSIQILGEWPESIQVNFITEPGGKCIHEETCAGSFDRNFVGQPVTRRNKKKSKTEENLWSYIAHTIETIPCSKHNAQLQINFSENTDNSVYVLRNICASEFSLMFIVLQSLESIKTCRRLKA